MSTSSRDEILGRLRQRARGADSPPPWQSRRQFDDLAARFAAALAGAKGEAQRAPDLAAALTIVGDLLATLEAERVVVDGAPAPLDAVAWTERFPECAWHQVGVDGGDLRAACAAADVGVSSAMALLAETGTLVLQSGPKQSRLATLLPPVHIALAPTSRLTTDLFTWVAQGAPRGGRPFPSNITLVSGPSKTADIEQTLAIGVHGPKRLMVVLYEE